MKFDSVSINFIVGLSKTQNNFDNIMVVVIRLTKIVHFIPKITILNAYGVAELFMREMFKHHGILREILSDGDCKFVSEFWVYTIPIVWD